MGERQRASTGVGEKLAASLSSRRGELWIGEKWEDGGF